MRAVALHRGKSPQEVREKFGQGRMLMAKDAKDVGLVDGISTVDREVGKSQRGRPPGTRAASMGIRDRVRKPSLEPFFVGHSPQPKGTR